MWWSSGFKPLPYKCESLDSKSHFPWRRLRGTVIQMLPSPVDGSTPCPNFVLLVIIALNLTQCVCVCVCVSVCVFNTSAVIAVTCNLVGLCLISVNFFTNSFSFLYFILFYFGFWDRVSLYSPGCPGTHFADQAGRLCLQSAEIKGVCHHCLAVCSNFSNVTYASLAVCTFPHK